MSNKKAKADELARATRAEKGSRLRTKACADRIAAHLQAPAEERKVAELDAEMALFEKRLAALEKCQSTLIELTDEGALEVLIADCEDFLVSNTAVLRAAQTAYDAFVKEADLIEAESTSAEQGDSVENFVDVAHDNKTDKLAESSEIVPTDEVKVVVLHVPEDEISKTPNESTATFDPVDKEEIDQHQKEPVSSFDEPIPAEIDGTVYLNQVSVAVEKVAVTEEDTCLPDSRPCPYGLNCVSLCIMPTYPDEMGSRDCGEVGATTTWVVMCGLAMDCGSHYYKVGVSFSEKLPPDKAKAENDAISKTAVMTGQVMRH